MEIKQVIFLALMGCPNADGQSLALDESETSAEQPKSNEAVDSLKETSTEPNTRRPPSKGGRSSSKQHQLAVTAADHKAAHQVGGDCESVCRQAVARHQAEERERLLAGQPAERQERLKKRWREPVGLRRAEKVGKCEYRSYDDAAERLAKNDADLVVGHVDCFSYFPGSGRPPMGLHLARSSDTALGAHYADNAREEHASVYAFRQLRSQLASLGAPDALLKRCTQAAAEEVHHTRLMRQLALDEGCGVEPVDEPAPIHADRREIAVFNAMSGCVAESYAALVALWQSEHALDPKLRAVYAQIAQDELQHAQLSWDIYAWLKTTVGEAIQCEVDAALQSALDALPAQADHLCRPDLPLLGLPNAQEMQVLSQRFTEGVRSVLAA